MRLASPRPCGWLLCWIMLVSPFAPSVSAFAGETQLRRQRAEQRQQLADKLERGFQLLERTAQEIPRETFDFDAIIAEVGGQPQELYDWVRDNTFWVPYQGALRGPLGVLMDRLGNSLDRSLLLAELLRRGGHECRLARAQLSEQQAGDMMPQLAPVPADAAPLAVVKSDPHGQDLEQLAVECGIDPAKIIEQTQAMARQSNRIDEELAQRVAAQAPRLLGLLEARTVEDAAKLQQDEALHRLRQLRQHWWVQVREGDQWVDLDTLLPTATKGYAVAQPLETFAAPTAEKPLQLEGEHCHQVVLRVVIERLQNGALDETTLLERTLRPADLSGQPITFSHHPVDWPHDLAAGNSQPSIKAFRDAILKQQEWIPLLQIGEQIHYDKSFTTAGEVFPATIREGLLAIAGKPAEGFGRVGGLLEGLLNGRGKRDKGQVTGQWIEYELRAPGEEIRTIRRQVFDVLGPARRAAGETGKINTQAAQRVRSAALAGHTEILPLVCDLSPAFVSSAMVGSLLANRDAILSLVRPQAEQNRQDVAQTARQIKPFSGLLYQFAVARLRRGPFAKQAYLGQINLVSHHVRLRIDARGKVFRRSGFDIVCNRVAVHAGRGLDPFQVRCTQGVLDTNLEGFMSWPRRARTVASAFTGGKWSYISQEPQLAAAADLRLSDDVQARLREELRDGYATIVGSQSRGWWRVDLTRGDVLGRGPNGHGAASTEYTVLTHNVFVGLLTGLGAGLTGCWSQPSAGAYSQCVGLSALIGMLAGLLVGLTLIAPFTGPAAEAGIGWLGASGFLGGAAGGLPGLVNY